MQKQGRGMFNYEVFKSAYDNDPRIQNIVTNFNKDEIELKQSESDDIPDSAKDVNQDNTVSNMAKNATDLGDKI
jgi:hypothetical protein